MPRLPRFDGGRAAEASGLSSPRKPALRDSVFLLQPLHGVPTMRLWVRFRLRLRLRVRVTARLQSDCGFVAHQLGPYELRRRLGGAEVLDGIGLGLG